VAPPPDDDDVAVEDEDDDEEELDTETDETDDDEFEDVEVVTEPGLPGVPETVTDPGAPAPDDDDPGKCEACLIVFNTPSRHSIAANCPEENPETETRGPRRHAR
jgi:hypothetical protein